MTQHIAIMRDSKGETIDVFYNDKTCLIFQSFHPTVIVRELGYANNISEAESFIELEYGSNVELD